MAKILAYLSDENGDTMLRNGHLVKGNALAQEVGDVLLLNQGQVKNAPLIGASLIRFVKGKTEKMPKAVTEALERDRKKVRRVVVEGGKIYPDVSY